MKRFGIVGAVLLVLGLLPPGVQARAVEDEIRWTAADSPILLTNTFVVPSFQNLLIEPGVEVRASTSAGLEVFGSLDAVGTPEDRIIFRASDPGSGWEGIRLIGDWNGHAALSHALVEYADTGIIVGMNVGLSHLELRDNSTAIRFANPENDVQLSSSVIYKNRRAIVGRTRNVVGVYASDFWNNKRNLVPSPQRAYDCGPDEGLWDIHGNDILRGPVNNKYFSHDVFTPGGSAASSYHVTMTNNWWGTTDVDAIRARMEKEFNCCPPPFTKEIVFLPVSESPHTSWVPPGEVPAPPGPTTGLHGDPGAITHVERPHHGSCYDGANLMRFKGTTYPALDFSFDVRLSLRRVGRGIIFEDKRPTTVRQDEYGIEEWSLRLSRPLRPGRYVLTATSEAEPLHLGRNVIRFRILPS